MIMKLWIYENHVWELRGEEVYNEPIQQPAASLFATCSSIGRVLHPYHRGWGFESHTGMNFFRLSFHNCKSCSLHNRCFMSQLKWMQHFAWSAKQMRSMRQGEERNKVPVMHGSIILLVTIPSPLPGQPPGKVQPFGTVWSSPVQGAGGSLWFCEVGAISHTV